MPFEIFVRKYLTCHSIAD